MQSPSYRLNPAPWILLQKCQTSAWMLGHKHNIPCSPPTLDERLANSKPAKQLLTFFTYWATWQSCLEVIQIWLTVAKSKSDRKEYNLFTKWNWRKVLLALATACISTVTLDAKLQICLSSTLTVLDILFHNFTKPDNISVSLWSRFSFSWNTPHDQPFNKDCWASIQTVRYECQNTDASLILSIH